MKDCNQKSKPPITIIRVFSSSSNLTGSQKASPDDHGNTTTNKANTKGANQDRLRLPHVGSGGVTPRAGGNGSGFPVRRKVPGARYLDVIIK
ncbi:hypothetical protein E3N88_15154 [Mikania micrantha]|uniref:Uncharacterized protein n=1 Tax=Mikania micrantha TaxID=192012 RepID=A0A5N6NUU6_9ASTR|nr:hypothetical protein E3N88_15154 [Mikania micrantha]